ncbi:MAG: hypothetical protein JEZ08_16295 [Clostridiales bacterium]|nr:hypothetical protein [Clostridiales bacterium]
MTSRCSIRYEVSDMNLCKNSLLVKHIYNEAVEDTNHEMDNIHPLKMICDAISQVHHIQIVSEIDEISTHAFVYLSFDDVGDFKHVKQVRRRFKNLATRLLLADVQELS